MFVDGFSMTSEVFTRVRYCGSLRILESLMDYDKAKREEIVAFAVYTLAHASNRDFSPSGPGLLPEEIERIVGIKSVPENSQQHYEVILDPNFIKLSKRERQSVNGGRLQTVSTDVATFNMSLISFASLDQNIYVSFVAKKEDGSNRACYVLECANHIEANRMYQSMERFFVEPGPPPAPFVIQQPPLESRRWDDTIPAGTSAQILTARRSAESENPFVNSDYFNASETPPRPPVRTSIRTGNVPAENYVNSEAIRQAQLNMTPSRPNANIDNSKLGASHIREVVEAARSLNYFFEFPPGLSSRELAEQELRSNGDDGGFLLREASSEYIDEINRIRNITLSVLNFTPSGNPIYQHVLMLDRESGRGLVRTQEKEFRSIEELIDHYLPEDRVLHLPSQTGHLNISVPIINPNATLRRNPPQENVYV